MNTRALKDPRHCAHTSINRILDHWICNACGAEFLLRKKEHITKWSDDQPEDPRIHAQGEPKVITQPPGRLLQ